MGIKGIYGEIGAGRRVALAKLSAEKLEESGSPLRIAIDISIWLFQVQSSQGGSNPAIRTLYYRLVRLLSINVQPLFVFDGPNRPPFKRNAKTANGGQVLSSYAKRLLNLFSFPYLIAPGEAEAECAALQQHGIVDYVLSEDVDTLAFGCTATMRDWSGVNERGNHAPTHVTVFEASSIRNGKSGLDREGMVLVALMSGGDYIPAGIPRCGIKVACEAARAGFGHDLCKLDPDDDAGFSQWKERLMYELETNESGFFRTRHKALQVPESFPDRTVLGYHARPNVSSPNELQRLRETIDWSCCIDIKGLRDFVDEEFEWKHLSGAKKFLRHLAPSLLAHQLYRQADTIIKTQNLEEQAEREERLILSITSRRQHISTDGVPEVKVGYIPGNIVGLDLDHESNVEADEHEDSSGDDGEEAQNGARSRSKSPIKRSKLSLFDPWEPCQTWVLEKLVKLGAPLTLEQWDTNYRKSLAREPSEVDYMRQGALLSYLRVTKPGSQSGHAANQQYDLPDPYQLKEKFKSVSSGPASDTGRRKVISKSSSKKVSKSRPKAPDTISRENGPTNPWTLAMKTTSSNNKSYNDDELQILEAPEVPGKNWASEQYDLGDCMSAHANVARDNPQSPSKAHQAVQREQKAAAVSDAQFGDDRICSLIFRERRAKRSSLIDGDAATVEEQSQRGQDHIASLAADHRPPAAAQRSQLSGEADAATISTAEEPNTRLSKIVLRESLEGTWKAYEADNFGFSSGRRFSGVDVLDLTNC